MEAKEIWELRYLDKFNVSKSVGEEEYQNHH
jgi:hypothetical protein